MVVGCFQNLYCSGCICRYGTRKEVSSCTEAKFCRLERILYRAVR